MTSLVKYDAMCRAIDAAYEVDEVKDIRDKALAIEAYAQQAKNTEAERRACEIRLRAERKAGQLLCNMEKNKGGDPMKREDGVPPVLSDLGITRSQSSKWQQLAGVPENEFEAALGAPEKPSTAGILRANGEKPKGMDKHALWLWGRLRDFERDGILERDPAGLRDGMTDAMQADVSRLIWPVVDWLKRLGDESDD